MASNFDKDKYKSVFEQRFGKGSYDAGQSKAYNTGRLKVEARIAKDDYEKRYREYQKELERQQKEREKAEKKRQQELEQQREMEKQREELKPKKKEKSSSSGFSLEKAFDFMDGFVRDTPRSSEVENRPRRTGGQGLTREEKAPSKPLNIRDLPNDLRRTGANISNASSGKLWENLILPMAEGFDDPNRSKVDLLKDLVTGNLQSGRSKEAPSYEIPKMESQGGQILSDLIGYGIGGIGAAGALRSTGRLGGNMLPNTSRANLLKNAGTTAKEGAAVGALMSGTEVAGREVGRADDYNWKQNAGQIALETAGGAILDPIISLAAPAFKQASRSVVDDLVRPYQNNARNLMQDIMDSPSEDMLRQMVIPPEPRTQTMLGEGNRPPRIPEMGRPDVPNPPQGNPRLTTSPSQQRIAQNKMLEYTAPQRPVRTEDMRSDEYYAQVEKYFREVEPPKTARDYLDARSMKNDATYEMESLADELPKRVQESLNRQTNLNPARNTIRKFEEAQLEWDEVKRVQAEFNSPKTRPEWAKFSVPDGWNQMQEFQYLPRRFVKKGHSTDIYQAMEMAGYDNVEEFVDVLRDIDIKLRTKKADLRFPKQEYVKESFDELDAARTEAEAMLRQEMFADGYQERLDFLEKNTDLQRVIDYYSDPSTPITEQDVEDMKELLEAMYFEPNKTPEMEEQLMEIAGLMRPRNPQTQTQATNPLDELLNQSQPEPPPTNPLDDILGEDVPPVNEEPSYPSFEEVMRETQPEIPPTFREDLDAAIRELMDEDGLTFEEAVDELRFDEYYQDFSDEFEETVSGLGGQTYTRPENDPFENYDPLGAFAGRNKGNEYAGSPIADPVRNVKATLKDHIEEVRTAFDSSIYPVKKLVKDITKQYRADIETMLGKEAFNPDGTLKVKYNPAKGIEEIPKSISRGLDSYAKGMKPIQKLMNEYKMSDRNVSDYLVARHAKDIYADNTVKLQERGDIEMRLAQIEEARINGEDVVKLDKEEAKLLKRLEELKPYELPRIATEEWVERILARFDNRPEYRKVQELYVKEQRKNLEMQLKAGLITRESFDRMVKKHPNYVSMMREVPNKKTRIRTGSGGNARSSVQERKLGSADLEIKSVFESAMRNRIAAVQAIDKNRVVQSVHNLSSIPEMQDIFRPTHPNSPNYRAENVISGFVDGKQVYYEVPEAIKKSFEYDGRDAFDNVILRALQGVSTMFKRGTTNWNPAFQLMSAPREALVALNNSNTHMKVLDLPMGFLDSFFGESLEKVTKGKFKSYKPLYRELGGEYSGFISQDQFQVKKLEEVARKGEFRGMRIINPLARLEQFGRTMEHGTRLAEFHSAMRQGLSPEDASFEASNVINYADQGTVGRQINKFVPYFTPTMRGNIRTMQSLKNNPARAISAALVTTTMPTLLAYGAYTQATDRQRMRIDQMPDYIRNNYWAMPVLGSENDDVVLYPKPQIYAQLFANPIERALDMTLKERGGDLKEFAKDTGLDTMSKLAPPTQAALLSGALEIRANYDFFTKRPIETGKNYEGKSIDFNPNMPNSEKYNSYTSEPAKWLGELTNQSPMKIDHALRSIGGTVGSDYLDILSNLIAETQGTRPSTDRPTADILNPFRSFDFKETSATKDYWENSQQASKDAQAYRDRYPEEERLPVKDRPKTVDQKAREQLKELNDRIFEINESFDLTPQEKKEMKAELRDQQREILEWLNQQKR